MAGIAVALPAPAQLIIETATATTHIRVNCGGSSYTDGGGNVWSADYGYTGGSIGNTTDAISGTTDDTLYQSERWDNPVVYQFTVPNGNYTVKLYFADIYSGTWSVGARVFDIQLEGTTVLSNLDIYSEVGGDAALIKTFSSITVSDGQLNINMPASVENAKVSAIEIISE